MSGERVFTNSPTSIAPARRYVVGLLPEVPNLVADEIAVMVSELATNCVRHAGTDFTVGVEVDEHRIRVAVSDGGAGRPIVRSPGPREPSGRGLRIVRELADSFGIQDRQGAPGKTVWFVVELDRPAGRTDGVGHSADSQSGSF
jgi:anti-sigma regulatory factor (Ser/Thr protein kinase)